ncbi:MAG: VanZ family protein [Alphaproteobacteria bacterium]|nr:VanZ family protein [Alphaproteobacteria bacterium]
MISPVLPRLLLFCQRFARWIFVPALAIVVWGELRPSQPEAGNWDKVLHFTAYFGLAAIATIALGRRRSGGWAALALALFGGALEIVQSFVGRDAEWGDEFANIAGASLGFLAGWASMREMQRLLGIFPRKGDQNEHDR